jgi:predicted metal-dependent phosphoesterase TrpH
MDRANRVQFETPNLNRLVGRYTVVDMHFHSHHSDGRNGVAAIAERAADLGIGVAITDHNAIGGAVELSHYPEVMSIPGIEMTASEGTHLLAYFYHIEDLKRFYRDALTPYLGADVMSSTRLPMRQLLLRAKAHRGVVIFPHPYCAAYTGVFNLHFSDQDRAWFFQHADGVEAINAENLKKWNLKCALLGFNLDKAVTAGSDGHTVAQLGRAVCYADCKPSPRAFLDAVRARRSKVVGKETTILRKVSSNGMKLKTSLKNTPDLVEKNIRYGYTVINTTSRNLRDNVMRSINGGR